MRDWDPDQEIPVLVPHRLLASTVDSSPLLLDTLVRPDWSLPNYSLQNFLPTQVFSFVSPNTFVLSQTPKDVYHCLDGYDWTSAGSSYTPHFLTSWSNLERMVFAGMSVGCSYVDGDIYHHEEDLSVLWADIHGGGDAKARRKFELVFDFVWGGIDARKERTPPSRAMMWAVLDLGGVKKELISLVDLKVVVRVKEEQEESARMQIARDLPEWMKPFVSVEVV